LTELPAYKPIEIWLQDEAVSARRMAGYACGRDAVQGQTEKNPDQRHQSTKSTWPALIKAKTSSNWPDEYHSRNKQSPKQQNRPRFPPSPICRRWMASILQPQTLDWSGPWANAIDVFAGDQNSGPQVMQFMHLLSGLSVSPDPRTPCRSAWQPLARFLDAIEAGL